MKHKKLSLKVLEQDIRGVSSHLIGLILGRLSSNFTEANTKLANSFPSGSNVEILGYLQEIVDALECGIKELNDNADLIEQIPDIEVLEEEDPKKN